MLKIRPLQAGDLTKLQEFTDRAIGAGYYSASELDDIFARSQASGIMCSFVLLDQEQIEGVRISFPPGQWQRGKGPGLQPSAWPHAFADTAYFQSLFLTATVQGTGWGGRMSHEALSALKQVGAKGVVCHSWKESPNNSSTRYLTKLGFQVIREYPHYWQDVDYHCTRCKNPPCLCTAVEMYLDLEGKL